MELEKTIEYYKDHFVNDPLYKKILNEDLEKPLFEDKAYFEKVELDSSYSTKQATALLNIDGKVQTLVNYLNRNDMEHYLKPYRQGRYYRFDWKLLFQFKMILLLTEAKEYTPMQIAELAGALIETTTYTSNSYRQSPVSLNSEQQEFLYDELNDKLTNIIDGLVGYEKIKQTIVALDQEKLELQNEIKFTKQEKLNLVDRISDLTSYMKFFKASRTLIDENEKSHGIISRLLSRKSSELAKANDAVTESLNDFEVKLGKMNDNLESFNKQIEKLEAELEVILIKLEKAQQLPDIKEVLSNEIHRKEQQYLEQN